MFTIEEITLHIPPYSRNFSDLSSYTKLPHFFYHMYCMHISVMAFYKSLHVFSQQLICQVVPCLIHLSIVTYLSSITLIHQLSTNISYYCILKFITEIKITLIQIKATMRCCFSLIWLWKQYNNNNIVLSW